MHPVILLGRRFFFEKFPSGAETILGRDRNGLTIVRGGDPFDRKIWQPP